MKKITEILCLGFLIMLISCTSTMKAPFHQTAEYVDLKKFSGDWYVIALLPSFVEKSAANGVENYSLLDNGEIKVKYTFRKGSSDGKEKIMYQRGWVYNKESNADWRVRPIWPLKLPYYILEVADDYSYTVIGTNNYKYLWIMARSPKMDSDLLNTILGRMEQRGYDKNAIQFMEQKWDKN